MLPASHYLESWGDAEPVPGFYAVRQPVVRPLFATESLEDRLIQLAGGTLAGSKTFHEYLKERWKTIQGRGGAGGDFRGFWQSVLQAGYFAPGLGTWNATRGGRNFNTSALDVVQGPESLGGGKSFETDLKLGLYYKPAMLDGTGANNAYRQELPDSVSKNVWTNYAAMLPATGRKLKLKQGSVVEVKTAGGSVKVPVHLQVGLHPGAVLVALGYGRTAAGTVGNDHGANAVALAVADKNRITFSGVTAAVESTGDRDKIPTMQQVYRSGFNSEDRAFFAPDKLPLAPFDASGTKVFGHDRPIVLESTLAEYVKNPGATSIEKSKFPSKEKAGLIPTWVDEKDIRWHMVVDLNACVGCGSCVTSCDLENNVPMVGPEQVTRSREMHWIRIDRYFSGTEENPDVAFQPMLCQQCENAPCENVCPVAATTHSHEGLNVMTYNRCIGTRYCANNCPFKVRRFNYFEYWNWWDGLDRKLKSPMQLGLNPDVAVRVRGVMEKCTFCIHRITAARHEMRVRGDKRIQDGTVKTACQEVCPTNAITFGDIHDKTSDVSRLAADARGYKVLDFLGVGPSITYLAKIRNRS
ncbi:MAG: 4Fe-4S dicluster domain-containing protein [Spirochaetia bacterium]|nr:4Fe-4S dicluster domain-containing protein [Spirochaetia bacterium]